MLRLGTTLMARTAVRPWRQDWCAGRGVDFAVGPAPSARSRARTPPAQSLAAEPPSFLDPAADTPPEPTPARRVFSPTAVTVEATVGPAASGSLRAWSRLSTGPART